MELALRPWRLSDTKALAELLNDPAVQRNLRDGLPDPYTEEDGRNFITDMLAADPDKVFAFAITQDGSLVGGIGVFRQENIHHRTAEMGYYLGRRFWGQGIGTWAVRETSRRLFATTDLLRIFAEPFVRNHGSCRVLEKAGFQCEGVMRKHAVKNGQVLDVKLYALVRE